jgi:hypothetical protein
MEWDFKQLQDIEMYYENTVKMPTGSGWSTVVCFVIVVFISSLFSFISTDCNIHILDSCRAISYKK